MPDLSTHYGQHRQEQNTPDARWQAVVEDFEKKQRELPSPSRAPTQPQVQTPTSPGSSSFAGDLGNSALDLGKQVIGGARDAAQEARESTQAASDWLNDNVLNLRSLDKAIFGDAAENLPPLPEVEQSGNTVPQMARGVSQFLSGFIPLFRGLRVAGAGGLVSGAGAGVVTDAFAFDPKDPTASNMIEDLAAEHPALRNPITEFLAVSEDDTEAEGRFKRSLEGLGLGVTLDGLIVGLRAFRKSKRAAAEAPARTAGDATPPVADDVTPARGASPMGKPVRVRASPAVRKLALELGVDLASIKGSGSRGQITRTDVDKAVADDVTPAVADDVVEEPAAPAVRINPERADDFAESLQAGNISKASDGLDFNFETINASDDIKKLVNTTSEFFGDEITAAKGGEKRTLKEVKETADLLGSTPDQLTKAFGDTQNLDARVVATKRVLLASTGQLRELMTKAAADTATDLDLLALKKHAARHAAITAEFKGVQTEVARALNAMKIVTGPYAANMDEIIQGLGGRDSIKKFARAGLELGDDVALNGFVRKAWWEKLESSVVAHFMGSILYGPTTQMVNVLSNSLMPVGRFIETGIASSVGATRRALGAAARDDDIVIQQLQGHFFGAIHGFKDAIRVSKQGWGAFADAVKAAARGDMDSARTVLAESGEEFGTAWRTLASGEPQLDALTKLEHNPHALSAEAWGATGTLGKALDAYSFIMSVPTRGLVTMDEFFKSINYQAARYEEGYQVAAKEGLEGDAFKGRVAEVASAEDAVLHKNALQTSREMTFTNELGELGQGVQRVLAKRPILRMLAPFVRTPVNILKYVGNRTPLLNEWASHLRGDLAAGGARRDMAMARTAMGATLYGTALTLALDGKITGGGPKDQKLMRDAGWQPYSFKVGDEYFAFNRTDPFGMFFGLAADIAEISGQLDEVELDELSAMAITAFSKNVFSKTWMTGISEAVSVMDSPDMNPSDKYMRNLLASFIPNFFRQTTSAIDPQLKEIWDITDATKARFWPYSEDVLPQIDALGKRRTYSGSLGPDWVSPIYNSSDSKNPVREELARLQAVGTLKVDDLPKSLLDVDLTKQEYHDLSVSVGTIKLGGMTLEERLGDLIKDTGYRKLPDGTAEFEGGKVHTLKLLIGKYREAARKQFLKDNQGLRERVRSQKQQAQSFLQ